MRRKTISKRFKVTGTGKILRRAMSQGHFLAKKRTASKKRTKHMREVSDVGGKISEKISIRATKYEKNTNIRNYKIVFVLDP